jgi:hypothetical protein
MQRRMSDPYDDIEEAAGATLLRQLERMYARPLPAQLSNPASVLMEGAPARRGLGRHGAGRALFFAFAITVLLGAGYGASLLASTWQRDAGLERVASAGLAREVQQRQTVDGVTVTLERAYADPNRIAIGLSVDAAALGSDVGIGARGIALRDRAGRVAVPMMLQGSRASSLAAEVAVFDAADLDVIGGQTLELEVTVTAVRGREGVRSGPWQFHVELPVTPALVAIGLVQVAAETVIDVRIVAAPSETRVYTIVNDASGRVWTPIGVRVEAGGRSYRASWGACRPACTLAAFPEPLPGEPSGWIVHIEQLRLLRDGADAQVTLDGPWRIGVAD